MDLREHTALLDKTINPPAKVGDPPGPVPPANSRFGLKTFLHDIKDIQNGTVPITILISTIIGIGCGFMCFFYFEALHYGLHIFWDFLPEHIIMPNVDPAYHWVWIPIVVMTFSAMVGLTVKIMGRPGNMAHSMLETHELGYIPMKGTPVLFIASATSIVGGGSLGPEAPITDLCASVGSWISIHIFKQKFKNIVRKHTLCGMACGCSAFFGVPMGGALFALEQTNRLGYEYFEHALAATYSGVVCLAVFRKLAGLEIGPVWLLTESARRAVGSKHRERMINYAISNTSRQITAYHNVTEIVASDEHASKFVAEIFSIKPNDLFLAVLLGIVGAGLAYCYTRGQSTLVKAVNSIKIFENPITKAVIGGAAISAIGLMFPHTMFWGEFEFQTIAFMGDSVEDLPHLWPHGGYSQYEITNFYSAVLVGFAKLSAIAVSAAAGYSGGLIFPLFCAGAGFGRAFQYLIPPEIFHPVLSTLCVTAGLHASMNRTPLSTPIILAALSGEPSTCPVVLAASMASVLITTYTPFITTQRGRDDLFDSLLHSYKFNDIDFPEIIFENENEDKEIETFKLLG